MSLLKFPLWNNWASFCFLSLSACMHACCQCVTFQPHSTIWHNWDKLLDHSSRSGGPHRKMVPQTQFEPAVNWDLSEESQNTFVKTICARRRVNIGYLSFFWLIQKLSVAKAVFRSWCYRSNQLKQLHKPATKRKNAIKRSSKHLHALMFLTSLIRG